MSYGFDHVLVTFRVCVAKCGVILAYFGYMCTWDILGYQMCVSLFLHESL